MSKVRDLDPITGENLTTTAKDARSILEQTESQLQGLNADFLEINTQGSEAIKAIIGEGAVLKNPSIEIEEQTKTRFITLLILGFVLVVAFNKGSK